MGISDWKEFGLGKYIGWSNKALKKYNKYYLKEFVDKSQITDYLIKANSTGVQSTAEELIVTDIRKENYDVYIAYCDYNKAPGCGCSPGVRKHGHANGVKFKKKDDGIHFEWRNG